MIPGIQLWITILRQMPSHVSHAENFLEAAHCVSQTGRMLLPSEYISLGVEVADDAVAAVNINTEFP